MSTSNSFIHLRCKTEYSLLNSVCSSQDLKAKCLEHKMPALGMCDDFNTFAQIDFSSTLSKAGIKPILGCLLKVRLEEAVFAEMPIYATCESGYKNILELIYRANIINGSSGTASSFVTLEDLVSLNEGTIVLTGGVPGYLGQYISLGNLKSANAVTDKLLKAFGNTRIFVEVTRFGAEKEFEIEDALIEHAQKNSIPLVATNDVRFLFKEQKECHDVLRCIESGSHIDDSEKAGFCTKEQYFKSQEEMLSLFEDLPEAIENTINIAKICNFMVHQRQPMLPKFSQTEEESVIIRKKVSEGLSKHLELLGTAPGKTAKDYDDRVAFELDIIGKMQFDGYFLIVSDFICWAKQQGIPVGPGRGSGAGSMVAWALQITDLDPFRYGLFFERFLNPERVSMPDFDIDFCQDGRDEVIEYVKNKYGEDKVASIITFGKLQAKAVLKDVGRVFQMPYGQVDAICKMIPFNPIDPVTLEKAIAMDPKLQAEGEKDDDVKKLIDISLQLEGCNRHRSTHAAGIVIGDKPLKEIATICMDDKAGMPVIGLNMKDVEKAGLVKFDFLGLKTLTVISECCKLVEKTRGIKVDIDTISISDEETFRFLRTGQLRGIFQLEAALPRETLAKIKTDRIEDIVAITSLNRPGPMENIPTYIRCKLGQEEVKYPHPSLEETLKETYGVVVYQEQVMQIAQVMAGYSLGAADLLRRAMGKKIKEEMDAQREIFVSGATKNGIEKASAENIFNLVEKFAGYGFNKSHAAAYAIISYRTAYLKAHYLVEFLVANLNLEISHTDKINDFINDAKEQKINIVLPDINVSDYNFTASSREKEIVYGLCALKGVGEESAKELVLIRSDGGPFSSIFDMLERCGSKICNKKQLESFIKSGALDKFIPSRKWAMKNVEILVAYAASYQEEASSNQSGLFSSGANNEVAVELRPKMPQTFEEFDEIELLTQEFEAVGFYLSQHPIKNYWLELCKLGVCSYREVESRVGADTTQSGQESAGQGGRQRWGHDELRFDMCGVVTKVRQRFSVKGRFAFVNIADLSNLYEVCIFNGDLIIENRELLKEGKMVIVNCSVKKEEAGLRLIANSISDVEGFIATKQGRVREKNKATIDEESKMASQGAKRAAHFLINEEDFANSEEGIADFIDSLPKQKPGVEVYLTIKNSKDNNSTVVKVLSEFESNSAIQSTI